MSIREHRTEDLQYMIERITWIQEETERRAVLKEKATIINPAAPRTAPRIHTLSIHSTVLLLMFQRHGRGHRF